MALIEPEHYEALFGPIKGRKNRMPDLKTMRRVTRGASEVMVKVTGYGRGSNRAGSHLAYITRHGKLEMENERGEILQGREELKDFIGDWQADIESRARRERQRDTAHIVLSMPAHVDAESVRNASREFAREMFGKNHEYVFALHTDEEHPHCHLVVKCRGHDGKWLNPRKADLQGWRDRFAEKLREQGVDAEATPRFTRGVVRKAQRSAIRHIERDEALGKENRKSWVLEEKLRQAEEELEREKKGQSLTPQPWESKIAERQEKVRRAWLQTAKAMEQEARRRENDQDREAKLLFAGQIRRFVEKMPAVETERDQLRRYVARQNKPRRSISTKHLERGQEREGLDLER